MTYFGDSMKTFMGLLSSGQIYKPNKDTKLMAPNCHKMVCNTASSRHTSKKGYLPDKVSPT